MIIQDVRQLAYDAIPRYEYYAGLLRALGSRTDAPVKSSNSKSSSARVTKAKLNTSATINLVDEVPEMLGNLGNKAPVEQIKVPIASMTPVIKDDKEKATSRRKKKNSIEIVDIAEQAFSDVQIASPNVSKRRRRSVESPFKITR